MHPYFVVIGNPDSYSSGATILSDYVAERAAQSAHVSLHEVVLSFLPRRLAFDMDSGDERIFARFMSVLSAKSREIHPSLANWDVYDSSNERKFSRHIISRDACVANQQQLVEYMRALMSAMPPDVAQCIDTASWSSYSRRSYNLRTCYSTKIDESGDARTKHPIMSMCDNDSHGHPWTFARSLLRYTCECEVLPERACADPRATPCATDGDASSRNIVLDLAQLTQDQVGAITSWCAEHSLRVSREITSTGLIDVERVAASRCEICGREHDHRGGYISLGVNRIVFYCRRADDVAFKVGVPLWERTNYRADFLDPDGKWSVCDFACAPTDLTTYANQCVFRKLMQRTLAFIIGGVSVAYFLVRDRDDKGRVKYIICDSFHRRFEPRRMASSTGRAKLVAFDDVLHRYISDIRYNRACFEPKLFSHNVTSAQREPIEEDARDMIPDEPERVLNMFAGFAGDSRSHVDIDMALVEPFLAHIRDVWCRDNVALYQYVIGWFATLIQHPTEVTRTALIVQGEPGVGKSMIVDYVGQRLIGDQYYTQCGVDRLQARFNSDMSHRVLVLIDEMHQSETSQTQFEERLKRLVTETQIQIELKGREVMTESNHIHYVFTTNDALPLHIGTRDRRYCVVTCSRETKPRAYFDALVERINQPDAIKSIFAYFATYDLTRYDIRAIPSTEGLRDMQVESLSYAKRFLYEVAIGDTHLARPYDATAHDTVVVIPRDALYDAFATWCESNRVSTRLTKIYFAREVARIVESARPSVGGSRMWCYSFSRKSLQEYFAQNIGHIADTPNGDCAPSPSDA